MSASLSLDGYIEGPARELDWFEDDDLQSDQYCDEMLDSVGLALYGRRSYELMLGHWPNAEINPSSPTTITLDERGGVAPEHLGGYLGGLPHCEVRRYATVGY